MQVRSVNCMDNHDITPLFLAACRGQLPVLQYLGKAGAHYNFMSRRGMTPLGAAACEGRLECVRWLVEQGVDCMKADWLGTTPLDRATYRGHLSTVQYLLQVGADPEHMDQQGMTALHGAALGGQLDVVKLLASKASPKKLRTGYEPSLFAKKRKQVGPFPWTASTCPAASACESPHSTSALRCLTSSPPSASQSFQAPVPSPCPPQPLLSVPHSISAPNVRGKLLVYFCAGRMHLFFVRRMCE